MKNSVRLEEFEKLKKSFDKSQSDNAKLKETLAKYKNISNKVDMLFNAISKAVGVLTTAGNDYIARRDCEELLRSEVKSISSKLK